MNNYINNHNSIIHHKNICNCVKTGCKKKYCTCYANGYYCYECHCEQCENQPPDNQNYLKVIKIPLSDNNDTLDNIVCTCTKSNCQKKYCECYKAGKECSSWKCRCMNCLNRKNRRNKHLSFEIESLSFQYINYYFYYCKRKNNIKYNENVFDRHIILNHSDCSQFCTPIKYLNKKRTVTTRSTNNKSKSTTIKYKKSKP